MIDKKQRNGAKPEPLSIKYVYFLKPNSGSKQLYMLET